MPRATIGRDLTGRVTADLALGGDVAATITRDATGRVTATITVTGAGDRP